MKAMERDEFLGSWVQWRKAPSSGRSSQWAKDLLGKVWEEQVRDWACEMSDPIRQTLRRALPKDAICRGILRKL